MSENEGRKELNSWKEVAAFLGVSVRSAQRYEAQGLPVRRLTGEKGRVIAYVDDLVTWRDKNVATPKWWQSSRFLTRYALFTTALVVALGAVVAIQLLRYLDLGQPTSHTWFGSTLIVGDENGREVWRHTFHVDPVDVGRVVFDDLDADGRIETLVGYVGRDRDAKGIPLRCFSESGKAIWERSPSRSVSDRSRSYSPPYVLRSYKTFPSPRKDGSRWIVAAFVHRYEYPSAIVLYNARGELQGEYWHSGHFEHVETADVNKDGIHEIFLTGVSHSTDQATLVMFDPREVSGAEVLPPGHPRQLINLPAGTEKAVAFFERTRLALRAKRFNFAYRTDITPPEPLIQISVTEFLDRNEGYVIYTLDPNLDLRNVSASVALTNTYMLEAVKDRSVRPFDEQDLETLRRGYRVTWRR